MPQGLAADQHGRPVQLLSGFILPADVDIALVPAAGPLVDLIIGDLLDLPGVALLDGRGIVRPIGVNVGALMNELPDLFFCRGLPDPLDDLLRILADDGA